MEWNENVSRQVAEKIRKIQEELGDKEVNADNIAGVLEILHTDVAPDVLYDSVKEMEKGIQEIYQVKAEQMNKSAEEILAGQLQGMTEEEQKGYLCQMFDSIKLSDETVDSGIEKAEVDSTDLAQMPLEELQKLVSEQMVNSASGLTFQALNDNLESFSDMDRIVLKTEEDALLLAAAQYSEALEGNIPFEYSKVPRLLGQCAAAQTKIAAYCEEVIEEDIPEETKRDKIIAFIKLLLAILIFVAFVALVANVGSALAIAAFEMVETLLGAGIIALIIECILIFPVMLLSFAAVLGAGAAGYAALKYVCELCKAAVPKIKEFYEKLVAWLGKKNPFKSEEDAEESEEEWESGYAEQDDVEEEDDLAYT